MRTCLIALAILASSGAAAQERQALLCVEEDNTGFQFENGRYRPSRFRPNRFSAVRDGNVLTVKEHDHDIPYECSQAWDKPTLLRCSSDTQTIVLDLKTLRFSRSSLLGHVDSSTDSLIVAYGTCQRF